MPAKRSWRPTRHTLLIANVVVYLGVGVLCAAFGRQIWWGQKTLRAYWGLTGFHSTADSILFKQAVAAMNDRANAQTVEALARQALEVEPHSQARPLLASALMRQGRADEALAVLEQALTDDPASIQVRRQMIPILMRLDRRERFRTLLDEGIALFRDRVARYRPRPDATVDEKYNRKAHGLYRADQEFLRELESMRQRLQTTTSHQDTAS